VIERDLTLKIGDTLPAGTFLKAEETGPAFVDAGEVFAGKRVALFGLPGAYTGTCSTLHVPSFIRVAPALRDKGVDAIVCISVNDPFVMAHWGETTGGTAAGITFLADSDGSFTKAIGMDYTVPQSGFFGRCKRFSAFVEDGVVKQMNIEQQRGVCEMSAGETLLDQIA